MRAVTTGATAEDTDSAEVSNGSSYERGCPTTGCTGSLHCECGASATLAASDVL